MNDNHAASCRGRLDALEHATGKCSWTTPGLTGSGYPLFSRYSCVRQYMVRAEKIGLVTKRRVKRSGTSLVNIYTYVKTPSDSVAISPSDSVAIPPSDSVAIPPSDSVAIPPSEASGILYPVTNQKVLRPADIRIQLDGIYYEQCIANMLLLSAADERERYAEEIRSSSPIQEHAHV